MEEKSNHIITIGFISIIVLYFAIIDPLLVFAGVGSFKDIEDSVLVGSEKLANIHNELERFAGKKEYNGVYLGADGAFALYEDDNETTAYRSGAYAQTEMVLKDGPDGAVFTIRPARG